MVAGVYRTLLGYGTWRQMWSIRSMRDASVGIPCIGSGAAGKATFMLVREVSDSADMMIPVQVGYYLFS